MAKFNFETRANERVGKNIYAKFKEISENIVPTPFNTHYDYDDKHVTLRVGNKELEFTSIDKQIKLGNYCICMQSIGNVFPLWLSKSVYSGLLIGYIIGNMRINGNYVELHEKDVCAWGNISKTSFYRGLSALLRPACPTPCAGDNLSLLATTTRKGIYIVNHNYIFKGDYEQFIKLYEIKFPNGCNLNSNGKVIIER